MLHLKRIDHPRIVSALRIGALAFFAFVVSLHARQAGPWDLNALSKAPAVTWGATNGLVQELFYEGEPLNGKPTRVFAYLGRPAFTNDHGSSKSRPAKRPAMVLVHGGGGKAFKAWAEHWAQRGYVALAMDLAGNGPDGRLPDGGPDQSDAVKFREFREVERDRPGRNRRRLADEISTAATPSGDGLLQSRNVSGGTPETAGETPALPDAKEMWSYHAVAAVVRGHSLVRSLPDVDAERVGITGISWGGYLTCIVAGIDPRFKVAVPVYGCGFLGNNSVWKDGSLARLTPQSRALWLHLFDPSQYLGTVRRPILFVNGTTDFAYPLDSYQKSYRLVPEKWRHVSVAVNRPHGHIWTFPEVDLFVDSLLKWGEPLVQISAPVVKDGRQLAAKVDRAPLTRPSDTLSPPRGEGRVRGGSNASSISFKEVSLCYTTNAGPWQKREWHSVPAQIKGRQLSVELPSARPLVAFLAVKDGRGAQVSSEHVELP